MSKTVNNLCCINCGYIAKSRAGLDEHNKSKHNKNLINTDKFLNLETEQGKSNDRDAKQQCNNLKNSTELFHQHLPKNTNQDMQNSSQTEHDNIHDQGEKIILNFVESICEGISNDLRKKFKLLLDFISANDTDVSTPEIEAEKATFIANNIKRQVETINKYKQLKQEKCKSEGLSNSEIQQLILKDLEVQRIAILNKCSSAQEEFKRAIMKKTNLELDIMVLQTQAEILKVFIKDLE